MPEEEPSVPATEGPDESKTPLASETETPIANTENLSTGGENLQTGIQEPVFYIVRLLGVFAGMAVLLLKIRKNKKRA